MRILFGKAGGRCSYPNCGEFLVVPSRSKRDLPKNVAKIAHITAASIDGPRYDASLSDDERRAEPNLMLLCGPHHDAIDAQLDFHTVEWLLDAKATHERALQRGARYAIGTLGFKDLQIVCDALSLGVVPIPGDVDAITLAMEIEAKIELNRLSEEVAGLIELGMAQDAEVRTFVRTMNSLTPGFGTRLTARFKALYHQGVADGLSGDELFTSILGHAYENCGPELSEPVEAAALAVVAHLFSICEIFEHDSLAAR